MGTNGRRFLTAVTACIAAAISGCAAAGEGITDELDILRAPPLTGPDGAPKCSDASIDAVTGGVITTGAAHSLDIPSGQKTWNGEARLRLSPLSADYDYVGVSVRPRGQTFDPAATLTISFDHCPDDVQGPFKIYRWNYVNRRWDRLDNSRPSAQPRAVEVDRPNASDYALGAN